jgi:hypothetical protein
MQLSTVRRWWEMVATAQGWFKTMFIGQCGNALSILPVKQKLLKEFLKSSKQDRILVEM